MNKSSSDVVGKKGKPASHTRYRALGPVLIPVAVSLHVTISHPSSHPSGGRRTLLFTRPAVTFPAAEHHRPWPIPIYTVW